jgi:hypothetical protein
MSQLGSIGRATVKGMVRAATDGPGGRCVRSGKGVRDMARRFRVLVVVSVTAVSGLGVLASAGAASGGTVRSVRVADSAAGVWGRAVEMPGLGALNQGGYAQVESVSCGSAGNCAVGGFYHDRPFHQQGFVALERNGLWGRAVEVPGLAALNQGGFAEVGSVSCVSAGTCAAGGIYEDRHGAGQGFVVSEQDRRWGQATEVPGLAALNRGGDARVWSVSCGSPGNCAAGSNYTSGGHAEAFVADERNGHWNQAIEVPGLTALSRPGNSRVEWMSCASAGNCAAAGYIYGQGFVVSERDGQWGRAIEIPGLGALNTGGAARVYSVSCGSPGNCAAGGSYVLAGDLGDGQGFVTVERNGRWSNAAEMPGRKPLTKGQYYATVASVSCTPQGPCTAAGNYNGIDSGGFVVTEKNGRWSKAIKVPPLGLPINGDLISSVSCPAPGSCAAGGSYLTNSGISYAFVVSEKNGRWGSPMKIPGLAALPGSQDGGTEVYSVSCAAPGICTAGGSLGLQAFVTQDGTRARHTRTTAVPP